METLPTDYLDGLGMSQDCAGAAVGPEEPPCWGRMFPLASSSVAIGRLGVLLRLETLSI